VTPADRKAWAGFTLLILVALAFTAVGMW